MAPYEAFWSQTDSLKRAALKPSRASLKAEPGTDRNDCLLLQLPYTRLGLV